MRRAWHVGQLFLLPSLVLLVAVLMTVVTWLTGVDTGA